MQRIVRRVGPDELESLGHEGGAGVSAWRQACVQQCDDQQNRSSRRLHSQAGVLEERVRFGAHGCSVELEHVGGCPQVEEVELVFRMRGDGFVLDHVGKIERGGKESVGADLKGVQETVALEESGIQSVFT